VATPLTFGNHLKFGLDSYYNAKGRPTFLHRERERELETLREHTHTHTPYIHISRGALQWGPTLVGAVAMASGRMRARDGFSALVRSRSGVDKHNEVMDI